MHQSVWLIERINYIPELMKQAIRDSMWRNKNNTVQLFSYKKSCKKCSDGDWYYNEKGKKLLIKDRKLENYKRDYQNGVGP